MQGRWNLWMREVRKNWWRIIQCLSLKFNLILKIQPDYIWDFNKIRAMQFVIGSIRYSTITTQTHRKASFPTKFHTLCILQTLRKWDCFKNHMALVLTKCSLNSSVDTQEIYFCLHREYLSVNKIWKIQFIFNGYKVYRI